jgi:hypothetical protein
MIGNRNRGGNFFGFLGKLKTMQLRKYNLFLHGSNAKKILQKPKDHEDVVFGKTMFCTVCR